MALMSSRKITVQIPGSSLSALPLHGAIVDAISQHDVAAARDATNQLIDRTERDIDFIMKHHPWTGE